MKHRNTFFPFLLALTVAVSCAQAQMASSAPNEDAPSGVTLARCTYAPDEDACARVSSSRQEASGNNSVIAQIPRRAAGPAMRPRPGAYRRAYSSMWTGEWNGRGAAIGALIGGGLGVALGIRVNTDNHAGAQIGAPLIIGGLGALVGAVAGGNWPGAPHWRHRHSWPDDDDEDASAARPPAHLKTARNASAQAASAKPVSPKQNAAEPSTNPTSPSCPDGNALKSSVSRPKRNPRPSTCIS